MRRRLSSDIFPVQYVFVVGERGDSFVTAFDQNLSGRITDYVRSLRLPISNIPPAIRFFSGSSRRVRTSMKVEYTLLHRFRSDRVSTNVLGEQVEFARRTEPSVDFLFFLFFGRDVARYMPGCRKDIVDSLEEPKAYHGVVDHVLVFLLAGVQDGGHVEDAGKKALGCGDRSPVWHFDVRIHLYEGGCRGLFLLFEEAIRVVGGHQLIALVRH